MTAARANFAAFMITPMRDVEAYSGQEGMSMRGCHWRREGAKFSLLE
jgi:hypothetical protein